MKIRNQSLLMGISAARGRSLYLSALRFFARGFSPRSPSTGLVAASGREGRYCLYKGVPHELAKGRELFEGAIAQDLDYALAYLGVAESNWGSGYFGYLPPSRQCRRQCQR